MENIIEALNICPLFKGISPGEIGEILSHTTYNVAHFKKNGLVVIESSECSNIGVVINGSVEVKKIYSSGRSLTITTMNPGDIFGEVIIFSKITRFPSTILSLSDSKILFISREDIINLCQANPQFLNNIMGLLSDKVLMLNRKIKNLSCQTIRQKVANLLIEEHELQKSLFLQLPYSRGEMAEQLGIPRPSLSRELINMQNDGLIEFNRNVIKIVDIGSFENLLLN